ncbi:MAG: hypothetical protein Q6373_014070 [Candidatus Sigynarchaeota archaeon]
MTLKQLKLIELKDSIEKAVLPDQIEELKKKHIEWMKEAKELGERYTDPEEVEKEDTELVIKDMIEKAKPIDGVDTSFFKRGGIVVGFDESQQSKIGTYARVSCFKFAESHVCFENGKYKIQDYIYEPSVGYIEDSYQKFIVYAEAVENFVKNLELGFKGTPLEPHVKAIRAWRIKFLPTSTSDEWKKITPSDGYVADRIRMLDELLNTFLRMKKIKEENPDKDIIFLGDGISAFRSHIVNPAAVITFFSEFCKHYGLKYYTFSKTCRLREKNTGVFLLPAISEITKDKPFIIGIKQDHSKSHTFLVRLVHRDMPALRFDIPAFLDPADAIGILKLLIPFCPTGYPVCLEHAHKASQLNDLEWRRLDVQYLCTEKDPRTRHLINNLRSYVLP